ICRPLLSGKHAHLPLPHAVDPARDPGATVSRNRAARSRCASVRALPALGAVRRTSAAIARPSPDAAYVACPAAASRLARAAADRIEHERAMRIPFTNPRTGNELVERDGIYVDGATGQQVGAVVHGIPRFVEAEHYADSLRLRWTKMVSTLNATTKPSADTYPGDPAQATI